VKWDQTPHGKGNILPEEYQVEKILKHRVNTTTGNLELLVKWVDWPDTDNTWEPIHHFFEEINDKLLKYSKEHDLKVNLKEIIGDPEVKGPKRALRTNVRRRGLSVPSGTPL